MRSVGTLQDIENEKAEERVFELLMGLNDSYNQIKSKILAMPSLGRVFHMLRDEEDQRAIKSIGHLDHSAMAVFKGQNQSGQATEEPPLKCTYCDKEGHDRSGCFRLIGYPIWWPNKNTKNSNHKGQTNRKSEGKQPQAHTAWNAQNGPVQSINGTTLAQQSNGPPFWPFAHWAPTAQSPWANSVHGPSHTNPAFYFRACSTKHGPRCSRTKQLGSEHNFGPTNRLHGLDSHGTSFLFW